MPTWGEWDRHCAEGRSLPAWKVFEDCDVSVSAAPLRHRVPCVGYVVHERPWPGHIDVAKAAQRGLTPGPAFALLKRGEAVKNKAGEVVLPEEVVGPPRPGRKVCILGDTCDSRAIEDLARHADVLVHESTFQNALKPLAERAGHSTAGMAGAFARRCGAQRLILTHFSNRYPSIKGRALDRAAVDEALAAAEGVPMSARDDGQGGGLSAREEAAAAEQDANAIMGLVREAAAEMGRGADAVVAAYDFMRFPVHRKGPEDWPEGFAVPTFAELAEMHPNNQRRSTERRSGGAGGRVRVAMVPPRLLFLLHAFCALLVAPVRAPLVCGGALRCGRVGLAAVSFPCPLSGVWKKVATFLCTSRFRLVPLL